MTLPRSLTAEDGVDRLIRPRTKPRKPITAPDAVMASTIRVGDTVDFFTTRLRRRRVIAIEKGRRGWWRAFFDKGKWLSFRPSDLVRIVR